MSTLEFWNQVEEKRRELVQEYAVARKAKIAAGEPDPCPGQPLDCAALFVMSLKNPTAGTVGGAVSIMNFALAARRMVGENLIPTHRIATSDEIKAMFQQQEDHMSAAYKMEDAVNNRRTVHVRPAEPKPRGAESR